jgi:hypothetical protein
MKRLDMVIIAAALAAAAIFFAAASVAKGPDTGGRLYAEIYIDGELARSEPLDEDGEFMIETGAGYNLVVVEGGSVRVEDADCASKACVHSGRHGMRGSMIACLPHRLVIKVAGGEADGDVDAIAY